MARRLRCEYAGAVYHVLARGNRREAIFVDDGDRRGFLQTLEEVCTRTGWMVHAYVLMGNHYHLALETPEPNLVAGMGWLQNTYTRRFNGRHRQWGRLFGDRYKAVPVEATNGLSSYFTTLVDYIHLNPVRARLVEPGTEAGLLGYGWSSLAAVYAPGVKAKPGWMERARTLAGHRLEDTPGGRTAYLASLDRRAQEEEAAACGVPQMEAEAAARQNHLQRGWYWGSPAFGCRLVEEDKARRMAAEGTPTRPPSGYAEAEAERLLRKGVQTAGLTMEDLARQMGSAPIKVALAQRIRAATHVSNGWIAQALHMRSAANVSQILSRLRRGGA